MSSLLPQVSAELDEPSADARPMVRWWWFGGAVTEAGIDDQLAAIADSGLGGVELGYVYPLDPSPQIDFGSPEFLHLIGYAARRARDLRLRFDLTLGSGWSFGGSHIPPAQAAQCLRWEERPIGMAAGRVDLAGRWPGDVLVAAYLADGIPQDVPRVYEPLELDGGQVVLPAGVGPRTLLLATAGPTGQPVKRASKGAEGPVFDHYSREATETHIRKLAEPFLAAADPDNVTAVFCDSLEVYGADWTPSVIEEFRARRGYDPLPHLYHLRYNRPEGAQFRADYHETLSDLYEDNFLRPLHAWAHEHDVLLRVQSYGTPPARVSSYQQIDMIEGEGWGWRRIPETKWAASAAHHQDVAVVSSETWTWCNSPSFRAGPLDFKGEAHEHLLAGVNQFIGHGWPYSPRDVVDPGWAFYAASAITDRNAWWDAAPDLFSYLQRLCAVLRHGEHVADVALWLPYRDTYAGFRHGERLNLWLESTERIGDVPAVLREAGYDFDVIDERTSADSVVRRHRAIVVAGSTMLSPQDEARLAEFEARGLPVIVVDSDVLPSATHVRADELLSAVTAVVDPDVATSDPDVAALHRTQADGELYLVVNTGPRSTNVQVTPRTGYGAWQQWDARTRTVGPVESGPIALDLAPYEAAIVVTQAPAQDPSAVPTEATDQAAQVPAAAAGPAPVGRSPQQSAQSAIPLRDWEITTADGATRTAELPHVWEQDGLEDLVGTLRYATTVELDGPLPTTLVLDAGDLPLPERTATRGQAFQAVDPRPLGVVATVHVNGRRAGVLWDHPFRIEIGDLLQAGGNRIELEVSGLSLAATRSPEWRAIYEESERAYGLRYAMQEIDVAFDETRTGIFVVPELR
jgi:hypothetical protein